MIDFTAIRAGEEIVVGPLMGMRFWRYRLVPLQLLSWCLDERSWLPNEPFEADEPPELDTTHGVHAYKTMQNLLDYIRDPQALVDDFGLGLRKMDGIVLGSVALWGAVVICENGYRAQYARPQQFTQAFGNQADEVLARLRAYFPKHA
jgi:hypothetical protein